MNVSGFAYVLLVILIIVVLLTFVGHPVQVK